MRIAVAQTPGAALHEWAATRKLIESLVRDAAGQRADPVVLPECAWPAYCLGSRNAYFGARAVGLPAPADLLAQLRQLAQELRIAICSGHVEEQNDRLYNAATLIGRDGQVLGSHRKCFLWAFDRDIFDAGDAIMPVDTPFGRVGLMVCADARLPEIPATLAARGAELLLQPTAWVNADPAGTLWNPQPDFLIPARAAEFGVPIASASKWGREGQTEFVGSSLICDADGQVVARCSTTGTQLALAAVSPRPPRPVQITAAERAILKRTGAAVFADGTPTRAAVAFSGFELAAEQLRELTSLASTALGVPAVLAPVPRSADREGRGTGRSTVYVFAPAGSERSAWCASVDARELSRFACPRSLAAGGVLLLIARGSSLSVPLTQARACENRIYIAALTTDRAVLVSPVGRVLHETRLCDEAESKPLIVIDLAHARCKLVTDRTDVFAGRRPELYGF